MTTTLPEQGSFEEILSLLVMGDTPVLPNARCGFSYRWNFSKNEGIAHLVSIDGCNTPVTLHPLGLAGKLSFMSDIPPTAVVVNGTTVYLNRIMLNIDLTTRVRTAAIVFNQDGSCMEASANWNSAGASILAGINPTPPASA